ncbi:hypothetical protein KC19_6G094300 [Ceratodon purpureus]|uniref:Uncharacterized protein n=1 Tax=Ceratodon purpureus TaxID=3225 RepID=A0A8T0HCI8_CERPU|nr:hypothetical protein KC19_6G094300 [Ceratodon purpureus]
MSDSALGGAPEITPPHHNLNREHGPGESEGVSASEPGDGDLGDDSHSYVRALCTHSVLCRRSSPSSFNHCILLMSISQHGTMVSPRYQIGYDAGVIRVCADIGPGYWTEESAIAGRGARV